jgi:hypothetical protein
VPDDFVALHGENTEDPNNICEHQLEHGGPRLCKVEAGGMLAINLG